ncbi:MAG: hypothetical protein QM808_17540 [Steroidobacteraceae bacterium]
MKRMTLIVAAVAITLPLSAFAADMKPILPTGPALTPEQELTLKTNNLQFHRMFYNQGKQQESADMYLDPNMINHDSEEPSSAQGWVNYFTKGRTQPAGGANANGAPPNAAGMNAAPAGGASGAGMGGAPADGMAAGAQRGPTERPKLFVVTEGSLTMMAYAGRSGDPGASFGSNMFGNRADGRITEWWFSGRISAPATTTTTPAAAAAATDPAQWYPNSYKLSNGMEILIPNGTATAKARAANKKLVLEFLDGFFNKKNMSAGKVLSSDIKVHMTDVPSGAAFANFAKANQDKVTAPKIDSILFALAEGEMVVVGYPVTVKNDPQGDYAQNLLRVQNGKIVEWWYSGYPAPKEGEYDPIAFKASLKN